MRISYTPEQEELRRELRSYFAKLMTPERQEALSSTTGGEIGTGNVYRETVAQMGKDGWLTLSWPKEYGGQARSPMEGLIFTDEAAIAGAPVPFLTINSVAPTIMAYGTDEQKQFFLPKIAAGDLHFSIGYSEPGAGTDLAALRTTAVQDGDDYVINGQKMWTSLIQYADYVWLAVRTNTEAKKHRGISVLILDFFVIFSNDCILTIRLSYARICEKIFCHFHVFCPDIEYFAGLLAGPQFRFCQL